MCKLHSLADEVADKNILFLARPLAEPEPQRFESSGENGTSHWEQHDTLRITGPSNCKHLDRMTETASLEKDQSSGLTNGPKARVHTILPVGSSIHIDTEVCPIYVCHKKHPLLTA